MLNDKLYSLISQKLPRQTKKDAREILEAYEEIVLDVLSRDDKATIPLARLGKFAIKEIPARDGVVMVDGIKTPWHMDAHKNVVFKVNNTKKTIE